MAINRAEQNWPKDMMVEINEPEQTKLARAAAEVKAIDAMRKARKLAEKYREQFGRIA